MNEKQMRAIDQIAARWAQRLSEEEKARLKRAVDALKSGSLSFLRNGDEVRVINGESSYMIRRAEDRWQCSCPDFQNRGKANGWRCKHLLAYFLAERVGLVAESNGHAQEASAHPAQPAAAPKPQEQQPEAQAAPTGEGLEDPVIPWGKRKGQRLSQVAREDPEYIFWIARKMEPRAEADRVLQEAARALLADLVNEAVERAFADQAAMPTLPFGEEKGKPIHLAHPKWVAIMAKRSDEDARSFQDLVLYGVARRLHEARQKKRQSKASLDTQVLLEAIREVIREAIPAALEAARQQEADQEAIVAELADLRRRVEALEKASRAPAALAAREAMLAAR